MPRNALVRLLACGLLLVCGGCKIPQICCPEKGPTLPADFNGISTLDNSANIGVGEFFDNPVLTQLIGEGLDFNQELKILNQEVRVAEYEILARRGAYLPFVSLRGAGGFEKTSRFTPLGAAEDQLTYPGMGRFPEPLPNVLLSADLFWRIDLWKEFRNARDAAQQRWIAAIEARNYFATRLIAEIADNYYELAALDKRLEFLAQTIELQQQSLEAAKAQKLAARGTELGVQRFLAEVRRNESQMLIVKQEIVEVENRINFLVGRYPQPVDRESWDFINLDSRILNVGVPAQLLLNRGDIRAAERELAASGLDVLVARARFLPRLDIYAGIGFEAFNPRYIFDPGAFIANAAGELVTPLINRKAIEAEYLGANARQLAAAYEYQKTVLNAFTEVANLMSKVENYRGSVEIKQGQVTALEESVTIATQLFQNARAEYVEVLLAQRDLLEARTALIEIKQQQLSAIVNAYQALGGGYMLANSGGGYAELYCPPAENQPQPGLVPPAPDANLMQNSTGSATVPLAAVAEPVASAPGVDQVASTPPDEVSADDLSGKVTLSPELDDIPTLLAPEEKTPEPFPNE